MGRSYEGIIEIPLVEFWTFVEKYSVAAQCGDEIAYGVPRINRDNDCIEIDFAADSETDPHSWATQPKAVTQWKKPTNDGA